LPARIVVVHSELEFVDEAMGALTIAGYEAAAFTDPMLALDTLEAAHRVELLITDVRFARGKPNGISLALMARHKQPGIKILFTALPEYAERAEGLGEFTPLPVRISDLVAVVDKLLE
jgi:two-component SAPR family response regulator